MYLPPSISKRHFTTSCKGRLPILILFCLMAGTHLHAIGIYADSLGYKYPETARIVREHKTPFHKLKRADRRILKKEIRFQYLRLKSADDSKLRVHVFFLILSLVAIFLGSLFLAFAFAYGGSNLLAVLMLILGIGAFVVVLYFGIKKSKRLKENGR